MTVRSITWDLAHRVKESLDANVFPMTFQSQVRIKPSFRLEDLKSPQVTVVPYALTREVVARGRDLVRPVVQVGLQRLVEADNCDDIERLMATGEAIAKHILRLVCDLESGLHAVCEIVEVIPVDHQEEHSQGVFTSWVSATFTITEVNNGPKR